MTILKTLTASAVLTLGAIAALPTPASAEAGGIVLVHGMNMDGGAWREVFDRLVAEDYQVVVAQLPLTSIEDDIAAATRAIDAAAAPVVLVGHSYGGMVISQAGTHSNVGALVYVAAFLPEIGESLNVLNASAPGELPADAVTVLDDGHFLVEPEAWMTFVANGLPLADQSFTAYAQTASNSAMLGHEAQAAAWKDKPSWSAIATQDRIISPALQRRMTERAGAIAVEIDGGHLLPQTNPGDIVALIKAAAAAINPLSPSPQRGPRSEASR